MTANEIEEHLYRFMAAKRDFPELNHDGHIDNVLGEIVAGVAGELLDEMPNDMALQSAMVKDFAYDCAGDYLRGIEREFNRRS